ncbi:MAG: AAA family ATPase [Caldilineales bacterium]|nr:AAA family ATPase [Caldilineales bacterium]
MSTIASPTKPTALAIDPAQIPVELTAIPQWVGWRWALRQDSGKWTKPPIDALTGRYALPNDPDTWHGFDQALHAYQNGGRLDGIGFMFADGGGLVGIDLDDCRDPESGVIEPWARDILDRFPSYSEVSPSGRGVKVICRGVLPADGTNRGQVEMYQGGRYFALTGHRLAFSPVDIRPAQTAIDWLWHRITASDPAPDPARTIDPGATPPDDADLLATVGRSAQRDKLEALMAGRMNGYASPSQADMALCNLLAFYTGDAAQVDRIFRQSGLMREKWDERHGSDGRTYGEITISEALAYVRTRASYDPAFRSGGAAQERPQGHRTAQEPLEHASGHDLTAQGGEEGFSGRAADDFKSSAGLVAGDDGHRGEVSETPPPSQRFQLFTARDALQPQPPPAWIVDRLITPGSVSAVVGAPGSKKTYSLLDMAVCVAMGKPWLHLETKQGAVLIIDEESGAARLGRRLGGILSAHFANEETPIAYTCLAGLNLRQALEVEALQRLIFETRAALVIIDALADIMPGADENAVKDVQPLMLSLRRVADATGAAIALIHHAGKNGDYRGSSAIKGAVDLMLTVQSDPDEDIVRFGFEKARDVEPFKFAGQAHFSDGLFWLSAIDGEASNAKHTPSPSEGYVLRFLDENGPSAVSDIMNQADTCSPESARRAVYSLAQIGLIRREDEGGRGRSAVYALAEKPQL